MQHCDKCRKSLVREEEKAHLTKTFCEDCYIELIMEKSKKVPYLECDQSFMLRLKPGFDNRRLITTDDEK